MWLTLLAVATDQNFLSFEKTPYNVFALCTSTGVTKNSGGVQHNCILIKVGGSSGLYLTISKKGGTGSLGPPVLPPLL